MKKFPTAISLLLSVIFFVSAIAISEEKEPNYQTLFADKIEKTEGIAVCPDGGLFFAGNVTGKVYRIVDDETLELFSEGYLHPAGMACDSENRVYIAEYTKGIIHRIAKDGKSSEIIAEGLSEPNAMALASDGTIYVSESDPGTVVAIAPDGKITQIADKIQHANGLLLSDDESMLYVNGTLQMKTFKVMLKGEHAGKKKTFGKGYQMPDGIAVDDQGNIYICLWSTGEIATLSPDGKATIIASGMTGPASPAYKDGFLYITSLTGKGIYKLPVAAE